MTPSPKPNLSDKDLVTVDRIVSAFDRALQRGGKPKIEDYLRETPAHVRPQVLASLLRIEMEDQCKRGSTISPVQAYVARFPEHPTEVTAVYRDVVAAPATAREAPTGWFYLRHQKPIGPFGFDQMQKLAVAGDLRPRDLVCQQSNPEWVEAASIADLFTGAGGSKETKAPESGQWIRDDYVLLEQVGRGGMGEVYKAYRFSLRKEVALKIIRRDRFQHLAAARQQQVLGHFQKEMQATAKLRHDHIVSIHDTGDHNGLPFYTMDFVDTTLIHLLRQGPLPSRKAAEIIEKVARAVGFANDQGIIHRDIKPHNILLDKDKPLLTDLGLATVHEELLEGQKQREIAGTPPYMAPEQALAAMVDARTDVYGLGATLYHLITGRPPHQGPNSEKTLRQVLDDEPLAPRKLVPAIDADLESITLKCLEKQAERRYPTATALADDLKRYLEGRTVEAKRPTLAMRVKKWARREPIRAGLVGGIALLLLAGLLTGAIYNRLLSSALEEAKDQKVKADEHASRADRARADAEKAKNDAAEERKRATDVADVLSNRVLTRYQRDESLEETIANLEKDLATNERTLMRTPLPGLKFALTETLRSLYLAYQNRARSIEDIKKASNALAYCVKLQTELAKEVPAKAGTLSLEMGLNYIDLGGIYNRLGDEEATFDCDTKAIALLQGRRDDGYKQPIILESLATAHLMLALDYAAKEDQESGLNHRMKAVGILEELIHTRSGGLQTTERQLGTAYEKVAISLIAVKRPMQAMTYLDKAKTIFDDKTQYRRNLADVYFSQGNAYMKMDQFDQAAAPLENARDLLAKMRKELADSPQAQSLALQEAEVIRVQAKRLEKRDAKEAERLYKLGLAMRRELVKKVPDLYGPALVRGHSDLAQFFIVQKDWASALRQAEIAETMQRPLVNSAPKNALRLQLLGLVLWEKGAALYHQKEFAEAKPCFIEAQKHEINAFKLAEGRGTYGVNLYITCQYLFSSHFNLKEYKEARDTIRESIKWWPADSERTWGIAKDLALLCQPQVPGNALDEDLIPLLQKGLSKGLWTKAQVRSELSFQHLKNVPAFKALVFEADN